jgi:hypothetical protein
MWEKGISRGEPQADGTRKYLPGDLITREAMATFMFRVEAPKGYVPPKVSPFVDVPVTDQFYLYVSWMYESGVSKGEVTSAGRVFKPNWPTTREATAAFLLRASKL